MPNRFSRAGRTFLVFGITGILGVFVFLLILGGTGAPQKKKNISVAPKPVVIDKISLSVAHPANASEPETLFGENPLPQSANVTHDLGKKLAQEIIKRNPAGPGPAGAQKLTLMKPTEAVDAFIADALKTFDPAAFRPEVSLEKLAVVTDSAEAFTAYLRGNRKIIADNFSSINLDFSDVANINFPRVFVAYQNAIGALHRLPVPQTLVPLHQKELSLIQGQSVMMRMLAQYNTDPLEAYLAISVGDQLNDAFASLSEEFTDFAATHQLVI